jgi:hypothetical protein
VEAAAANCHTLMQQPQRSQLNNSRHIFSMHDMHTSTS